MLNCDCYIAILEIKNELRVVKECYVQNVNKSYVYLIYVYRQDLALNNLQ